MTKSEIAIKAIIALTSIAFTVIFWNAFDSSIHTTTRGGLTELTLFLLKPTMLFVLLTVLFIPFHTNGSIIRHRWLWILLVLISAGVLPTALFAGLIAMFSAESDPVLINKVINISAWVVVLLCVMGLVIGLSRLHKGPTVPKGVLHA